MPDGHSLFSDFRRETVSFLCYRTPDKNSIPNKRVTSYADNFEIPIGGGGGY